jgi:alkylated DNA nucleotide flippase Atl1
VTEVFLGVIAVAVLVMAIIQVAAIVFATRAARQVGDAMNRFERDVKPIVANLQIVSSEAARVSSAAAAQVQRAEQLMNELTRRVDETAAAFQSGIIGPARELFAVIQGIIAAFGVFRDGGARTTSRKRQPAEDEDALFIG